MANRLDRWKLPVMGTPASTVNDDDKKRHSDATQELWKRQTASWDSYDKSVITLSSAGLAVSLGFLKDFLPIGLAHNAWSLYASWWFLTGAVVFTMGSFLSAIRAQTFQIHALHKYYMELEELPPNPWTTVTGRLNLLSAVSFAVGTVLTTVFVTTNLSRAQEVKDLQNAGKPPLQQLAGSPRETVQRGNPPPPVLPRTSTPPAPAPAPAAPSAPAEKK